VIGETSILAVTVLPVHREALKRLAADEGEPMAAVVRRLIREEAQRRQMWPEKKVRRGQRQELAHAG
jgi:RNA polymerase-interacting CarD/CdnL/TRCF family regulator